MKRKYDIAISLEVAEHLPEEVADLFVDNITSHSDFVVFGAATPNQGGTHHVNEQKQSYWAKKFKARGYIVLDPIRGKFEGNGRVLYEYVQDTLLYVKEDKLANYKEIERFVGIPVLLDVFTGYESFDNTPKSWHWLLRRWKLLFRIMLRKFFKISEYSAK